MLRAGICGAGFIARAHAHGYAAHPDLVRVTRVVDPRLENARALAERLGATASGDVSDLFGDDVDIVSICTPTPTHHELTIAALAAGKHVLCEKPLARTLDAADAMIAAAAEHGRHLMVGLVGRYDDDCRRGYDLVRASEIGALKMAYQGITSPFPGWSAGNWFGDPARSGGPVLDLAIHSFDYLNWVFDSPAVRVTAAGARDDTGMFRNALVNIRFANGGLGLIEVSWAHPAAQGLTVRSELTGDAGRVNWDSVSTRQLEIVRDKVEGQVFMSDAWAAELGDFVRAVRDNTPPPITAADGRAALRVALAAIESLETGRTIELPLETAGEREARS